MHTVRKQIYVFALINYVHLLTVATAKKFNCLQTMYKATDHILFWIWIPKIGVKHEGFVRNTQDYQKENNFLIFAVFLASTTKKKSICDMLQCTRTSMLFFNVLLLMWKIMWQLKNTNHPCCSYPYCVKQILMFIKLQFI